jgi:hypothetical protein
MEEIMNADVDDISVQQSLEMIAKCIDQIYSEEESFAGSDSSLKELTDWVEDLEPKQFAKLEAFFTTMPKLSHTIEVTNPETEVTSTVVLEGLGSFFA